MAEQVTQVVEELTAGEEYGLESMVVASFRVRGRGSELGKDAPSQVLGEAVLGEMQTLMGQEWRAWPLGLPLTPGWKQAEVSRRDQWWQQVPRPRQLPQVCAPYLLP